MDFQRYLAMMKKSETVYQRFCQSVIREYDLNATSFQVIMFLANNPQYNTARDLCQMRGIKTGIASVAVEQLIQMGYLERKTDARDRRIQRLYVTDRADDLIRQGRQVQQEFAQTIADGLTQQEQETYFRLTDKLMEKIEEMERSM